MWRSKEQAGYTAPAAAVPAQEASAADVEAFDDEYDPSARSTQGFCAAVGDCLRSIPQRLRSPMTNHDKVAWKGPLVRRPTKRRPGVRA